MMICKTRVEPFDVLIKSRMTIMTSVDRATQLVDECQVKRRKGDPLLTKPTLERKNAILKNSSLPQLFKLIRIIRGLFKCPASNVL